MSKPVRKRFQFGEYRTEFEAVGTKSHCPDCKKETDSDNQEWLSFPFCEPCFTRRFGPDSLKGGEPIR